jgi:hypothetical protein
MAIANSAEQHVYNNHDGWINIAGRLIITDSILSRWSLHDEYIIYTAIINNIADKVYGREGVRLAWLPTISA